jgi:hypothetical protein
MLAGLLGAALLGGCGGSSGGDTRHAPASARDASTTTTASSAKDDCARPYSATSPWNTPIGRHPRYDPQSRAHVAALDRRLTSDPTQYTYPVYEVDAGTPRVPVRVAGTWSNVVAAGHRLEVERRTAVTLPIPRSAMPAAGSDAQIVIVDRATGDEWGAWQFRRERGRWIAENAYHYNVRWSGVPPRADDGTTFGSRGAGLPYLAGLVRPCDIARGRIHHALAFAYDGPSSRHVYPATKSDGGRSGPGALPEGARLQLDPSIGAARIRSWGCRGACLVVARALQRYGMYVVDNSGRPKLIFEYTGTAHWRGAVHAGTVSPIPVSAFRVLASGGAS